MKAAIFALLIVAALRSFARAEQKSCPLPSMSEIALIESEIAKWKVEPGIEPLTTRVRYCSLS